MPSVQKRGKNSFLLTVEAGYDANGNRIRRTRTVKAKNKTEAKNVHLPAFQLEVEAGEYISPEKMFYKDFVKEWKKRYAEKELAPTTLNRYMDTIETHLIPTFGHLRVDEIKTFQIVKFLDELKRKDGQDKPLSSGMKAYIYRVLKNTLKRAKEWKLIKLNPMDGIQKPKEGKREPQFYDSDESLQVVKALGSEPRRWKLYFYGALFGGFRRGELVALEWSDIDFDENTIRIDESISLTENGQAVIGKPKTESSTGTVEMPKWYMDELKSYRLEWLKEKASCDKWEGEGKEYVFHSGSGKPYYYDTPSKRWRKFRSKHKLKQVRLHDLRHSTAVLLLEQDVPLKDIQERLRHSRYQTTADIYGHISKKKRQDTASKFDKFDPNKKQA